MSGPNRGNNEVMSATDSRMIEATTPTGLNASLADVGLADLRFHDPRHTFASLIFAAGIRPLQVSRWLGQASVATTDAIDAHLYHSDDELYVAKIEEYVGGQLPAPRARMPRKL